MSKVWIITGSGSGLGRAIAEAGLEAGDQVVATARNTDQLTDLVARYGARVLAFELDVTIEQEGRAAVQAVFETSGDWTFSSITRGTVTRVRSTRYSHRGP
jgi:NAD(P)-dependent dehydrogenase (short-subunit alcohol dehydrogenase family)